MATLGDVVSALKGRKKAIDEAAGGGDTTTPKTTVAPPPKSTGGAYSGLSPADIEEIRRKRKKMTDDMEKAAGGWK